MPSQTQGIFAFTTQGKRWQSCSASYAMTCIPPNAHHCTVNAWAHNTLELCRKNTVQVTVKTVETPAVEDYASRHDEGGRKIADSAI